MVDRLCGRKKLPFAGYSIVKERLKLLTQWSAALATSFLSKLVDILSPGFAAAPVPADLPN
jgi:hypothetical protein